MKLLAALAIALALPVGVAVFPTPAEAQVLAGRNAARRTPPRPALSEREIERLNQAQDAVADLESQIATLEELETPTPEQTAELALLRPRLARERETVEELEAKRNRRRN